MSPPAGKPNRVKEFRLACGLSQVELAQAAGISRAGLSAIEVQRLMPAVSTALALAQALGTSVEALFDPARSCSQPTWAISPPVPGSRYWLADVNARTLLYPVEAGSQAGYRHDGVAGHSISRAGLETARRTLVLATCDPAVDLLAVEYARQTPFRLLVLRRSSRDALDLLRRGLVHAAGVHLAGSNSRQGNRTAIEQERLGFAVEMLSILRWQEGIAYKSGIRLRSVGQATSPRLRWIGRSPGAGARQCQDEVFGDRRRPRHIARDHGDVVASIRTGFADAGICVRLVAEEAHVNFLGIREEDYDLCFARSTADDPRLAALNEVIRSPRYREAISELPGYELRPADQQSIPATTT